MDLRTTNLATFIVVLSLLTLILLSRLTYFPLNLSLVNGYSMYPSLKPGDLLVSIHKDIVGYDVGDVVIWCSNLAHCVVHRVVKFGEGYVVTKGDNNPSEDPPVPESYVKYKTVLVIPSTVWLTTCLALVGLYLIRNKDKVLVFVRGLGDVEVVVFSVFTLINLVLMALVPIYNLTTESVIIRPSISLGSVELLDPGSLVLIKYNPRNLNIIDVPGCLIEVFERVITCSAYVLTSESVVVVVPPETYSIAYESGVTSLKILVNLTLDRGFLVGSYPLHISWSRLGISIDGSSLVLSNPNYVPINITHARITYMIYDEKTDTHRVVWVEELRSFVVDPRNTYTLLVERKGEYAYVMIKYLFMGEEVVEQRRIDFS